MSNGHKGRERSPPSRWRPFTSTWTIAQYGSLTPLGKRPPPSVSHTLGKKPNACGSPSWQLNKTSEWCAAATRRGFTSACSVSDLWWNFDLLEPRVVLPPPRGGIG